MNRVMATIKVTDKVLNDLMNSGVELEVVQLREDVEFLFDKNWMETKKSVGKVLQHWSKVDDETRGNAKASNAPLIGQFMEKIIPYEHPNIIRALNHVVDISTRLLYKGDDVIGLVQINREHPYVMIKALYIQKEYRRQKRGENAVNLIKEYHSHIAVSYMSQEQKKFFLAQGFKKAPKGMFKVPQVLVWDRPEKEKRKKSPLNKVN